MDSIEKQTCLRIIKIVVDTIKKVNIDLINKIKPSTQEEISLSIPSWLLSAEDELKSDCEIELSTIICKVRQNLKDFLKGLGPSLAVFCGIIYIEHILNEEIQKLPRKFRYGCIDRRNILPNKRRGADRNMFLHSHILLDTLKDIVKPETKCNESESKREIKEEKTEILRSTETNFKISSEQEENLTEKQKFSSCKKNLVQRKGRKSKSTIDEVVILDDNKNSLSLSNPRSLSLRSRTKILEKKEYGSRKESSQQSNVINKCVQDMITGTIIKPEYIESSPSIVSKANKPYCYSILKTENNHEGTKKESENNQLKSNQPETKTDNLINNNDICKLEKKANKLSLTVDRKIKHLSFHPPIKEEDSMKHQQMQFASGNSCKIKRKLPLRGKRAHDAKECENTSKIIEHDRISDKTYPSGSESAKKKFRRSNGKVETIHLSEEAGKGKVSLTPQEKITTTEGQGNSNSAIKKHMLENPENDKGEKKEMKQNNNFNFTSTVIECSHKDDNWKATTLTSENKYESLKQISQVLEVSCFLHACQKVLHLPFFTHFEFEWALLIPQASKLMAKIMTALLNASPASKKERFDTLSYLEWNRRVTGRISHWFFIQSRLKSTMKVCALIGIEPTFWEIFGGARNPLSLRPFHQLTICQRVIIIKALCDHLLHVSKRIQTAIISTPNNGREAVSLGRNARGNILLFFPILARYGKGDIRIYEVEEDYSTFETENQIKEADSDKDEKNRCSSSSHFHSVSCICKDGKFTLVADDFHSLDKLAEMICSNHTEEEFQEAEKKLAQKSSNKIEKEQETDGKEENQEKELANIDDSDLIQSCEHLKLALNINILAKNLWSHQQTLKKSYAAAKAKLAVEWEEYSKDRLSSREKINFQPKISTQRYFTKNNIDIKNLSAEMTEEGHQNKPTRVSLSRRVKRKTENLSTEMITTLSRKEIVSKMEEDALMGKSKASEEEKWEPSLWADEDSEDEESSAEEDSDWKGYESIENNLCTKETNTSKKETDEEIEVELNRGKQIEQKKATKTYARILMIKSVKNNGDIKTDPSIKDAVQLKRLGPVINTFGNTVTLSKCLAKGKYLIAVERFKNNISKTMKNTNQDRYFGKLHFNSTDDFENVCGELIESSQGINMDPEINVNPSTKHAQGSFSIGEINKSYNLQTISEEFESNKFNKDKESLLSHIKNQKDETIGQTPNNYKQERLKREQEKLSILENEDGIDKILHDNETTKKFKPFPLRSIVLRTEKNS